MKLDHEPTLDEIRAAHARIRPLIHRTPVLTCRTVDELVGGRVFFKCENFQKVGAFKYRGACNALLSLPPAERDRGVATHSSGNHAQALARAAREMGVRAFIVMPRTAPAVKRAAVEGYGAEVVTCEPTLAAREEGLAGVVARTGAAFVHPYDNWDVIAGQGTAALELLEEVPDLDVVLAPVGGGGLMSGTAIVARESGPGVRALGAEPEGAADAFRSLREGRVVPSVDPDTIADGLLTSLSERTFGVLSRRLEGICTVPDDLTVRALRLLLERMKIVVEPSSAVPLGALLGGGVPNPRGRKIGVILSGGNVDFGALAKRGVFA